MFHITILNPHQFYFMWVMPLSVSLCKVHLNYVRVDCDRTKLFTSKSEPMEELQEVVAQPRYVLDGCSCFVICLLGL